MDNENKNFEEELNETNQSMEEVTVEEPIAEEAVSEEPITEEVVAEEPVMEEAAAEEPVMEEVAAEEPIAEEAVSEEPVAEEAVSEEPVMEEVAAEETEAESSVLEESVTEPTEESFLGENVGDDEAFGGISLSNLERSEISLPKKKSNVALFATMGVIIVALLVVITVLLVGSKPNFFNPNAFKEVKVGSVGKNKVTEGELRIMLQQEEYRTLMQAMSDQFGDDWQTKLQDPEVMNAINNFDWTKTNADGVTYAQLAKESAFREVALVYAKAAKIEEMGLGLTDAEKESMNASISQMKAQYGSDEAFTQMLNQNYFKDEKSYLDFFITYQNAMKFESEYEKDPTRFIEDESGLEKYVNDTTVSAKHILIKTVDDSRNPLPDDQIEAARAKADQVLARAKSGEDFDALISEYNEDPGQNQNKVGYAFGKGEMDPAFEKAAFALGVNEISDVVQSSYGYHIIKRVVGLSELEEQLINNSKVKENKNVLAKLKLMTELQKEQAAAASTGSSAAAR